MKIYVASSWRNAYQQSVVNLLRALNHEVYDFKNPGPDNTAFQWSAIDPFWDAWTTDEYRKALEHPLAVKGFENDFSAMEWADCCVMVLPCGRSANSEAGWFKGAGMKVFVFSPENEEPELMYKMYDGIFATFGELVDAFNEINSSDGVRRNSTAKRASKGTKAKKQKADPEAQQIEEVATSSDGEPAPLV
jgi:hypothetical protein